MPTDQELAAVAVRVALDETCVVVQTGCFVTAYKRRQWPCLQAFVSSQQREDERCKFLTVKEASELQNRQKGQ